ERGILVGPRGDFVWMCFPQWADEAVFSSLMGGGGEYSLHPVGRYVWGGYYEPGTLAWRSRWVTEDNAIVECREALALPAHASRAVVLRRVIARAGTARMSVALSLRAGFGRERMRDLAQDDSGRWTFSTGDVRACWAGGERARPVDRDGLALELSLEEGEEHDFVLALTLDEHDIPIPVPSVAWKETETAWRELVPAFEGTLAERDVRHAYAVMSGLTSASGGMVASATMSLPERARAGRNYDYRYTWIRDQCFAGQAVAKLGPVRLLDTATAFVRDRLLEHGRDLAPAYTTSGARVPGEHALDLPGYPGGTAVAGNKASEQFQLDVFGEALLLFAAAARNDRLDADSARAAAIAAQAIEMRWTEADAGIWELEPDNWTHSRLICAAGLRAISAGWPSGSEAARWLALADAIVAETSASSLHASGRWQRSPRDDRVDGALLLPAIRGAVAVDDPRTIATLDACLHELTMDGYAYRFRPDERPLGESEGAFLFCGFVLSLALTQQGEHVAAARWFERNRAACGPPGLLAEEFDVTQRQLRGNLPQAFVHALLLECAAEQSGA
ncbi:MAG: glycoside hydrolase family 15 protein, partial [Actinobacteria bacterium]|nr:glycoside hydrolase family 15 protein [Actinomycetota bacterium]